MIIDFLHFLSSIWHSSAFIYIISLLQDFLGLFSLLFLMSYDEQYINWLISIFLFPQRKASLSALSPLAQEMTPTSQAPPEHSNALPAPSHGQDPAQPCTPAPGCGLLLRDLSCGSNKPSRGLWMCPVVASSVSTCNSNFGFRFTCLCPWP